MNFEKCPLFVDWEEIFCNNRAIEEFAESPGDVVEEIERIEAQVARLLPQEPREGARLVVFTTARGAPRGDALGV